MSSGAPNPPTVLETAGPHETEQAAAAVADRLHGGEVVLVSGELGAGKTTWVRGAARALGVESPIVSPTFTLSCRYSGRVAVAHLDLYRLESLDGEDPALLDDYLGPQVVTFVEWPERTGDGDALGPIALRVRLSHLGGDRRRIEVA